MKIGMITALLAKAKERERHVMKDAALSVKPCAGDLHVWFDEGGVAPTRSRRGSLLYRSMLIVVSFLVTFASAGAEIPGCRREVVDGIEWYYHRVMNPLNGEIGVQLDGVTGDCLLPANLTIPTLLGGYRVTSIREYAFYGHTELMSVAIPDGVTEIERNAFTRCDRLQAVSIPSSVTSIAKSAFTGTKLVDDHADGLIIVDDCLIEHKGECSGVVVIPAGVRLIANGVFSSYRGLTSVTIPSSVRDIGAAAFEGCSGLKSVELPEGLSTICYSMFRNCSALESVTIPSSVVSIELKAFESTKLISDHADGLVIVDDCLIQFKGACSGGIVIPANVKVVAGGAFGSCKGLTSVTLPEGVQNIGEGTFSSCTELTTVLIPSSVTSIGDNAFAGCSGLTSVVMSESVVAIGDSAFKGCWRMESLAIPASVVSIGNAAFENCANMIASLTLSADMVSIGSDAFRDCAKLTAVTISAGSIGDTAFYGCSGLTSLTISSGVTSIGGHAFDGCKGLTSVSMQKGVTSIGPYAFANCWRMSSMSIPSSVTNIGEYAFFDCENLSSVVIPEGVVTIERSVFDACYGLKSVSIPSSVTSIESGAFYECRGLTSVMIPQGVTHVRGMAFSHCKGLTSVRIPSSVISIISSAFEGCGELNTVYVCKGDIDRVKGLCTWPNGVEFVEIITPIVEGDSGATVTGDAETGFVIKPSEGTTSVEVTIPQGVDAAKVTVEVSVKVVSVKPHGAKVKIVSGGADITEFLNVPTADGNGVVDLTKATVKEEIVKEAMDVEKGAKIVLDAAHPSLTTPNTRVGLLYQLREGVTIEGMVNGDSTIGNGEPWSPKITVKGGNSAFYSIGVGKGE